jgi:glutathione synthase
MATSKNSSYRFLWVTDPWETLDHEKDTTLRLAQEAAILGFGSYWCDVKSIRYQDRRVVLDAAPVSSEAPQSDKRAFPMKTMEVGDFSAIHYRVDPPVDLVYLHPLQLLNLGLQSLKKPKTKLVNSPEILFMQNEKMEASFLGALMPETLVSSQWEPLKEFAKKNRKVVLKPLHQAQSHGIELLHWKGPTEEEKIKAVLQKSTENFQAPVLLQVYLSGISEGEQRLWFVDGKLIATVRKHPLKNDFRVNIDAGSALQKTFLNAREQEASKKIGKFLAAEKIRLAAVDLIDGLVTDFNFTSPGLITQMEKVLGQNLAKTIIQALAKG